MYLDKLPRATLLYALETPPKGGDTLFANTAAAYDTLSEGMKRMLEGLKGVNSGGLKHKKSGSRTAHHANIAGMSLQNADKADSYESRHPIVRTHPETGRQALYVSGGITLRLGGMTDAESRPLIVWLQNLCIAPELRG